MDHKLNLNEDVKMADQNSLTDVNVKPTPTKEYIVTAEAGLFKGGKQYNKGDKINLVEKAAASFLAAGEITE